LADKVVQAPFEQQPVGQDVASHTQAPPEQRCPGEHWTPLPQVQAPPSPQPSAKVELQA
jgi:hypothetical protein